MNGGELLLVVDEAPEARSFVGASLVAEGFRIAEARTFAEAMRVTRRDAPELILLDPALPDGDGVEFTRRVRGWSRIPIIVTSARTDDARKAAVLDAGADDYITKPFGMVELLARIRVAFRHANHAPPAPRVLSIGELTVDTSLRQVTMRGREVPLTPVEYKVLLVLAENADRVLTRRRIVQSVWGPGLRRSPQNVNVRIVDLRRKLETDPQSPKLLLTVPGVGYRLRNPTQAAQHP